MEFYISLTVTFKSEKLLAQKSHFEVPCIELTKQTLMSLQKHGKYFQLISPKKSKKKKKTRKAGLTYSFLFKMELANIINKKKISFKSALY